MNPRTAEQEESRRDADARANACLVHEDRTRSIESVGKLLHALELENHKLLTAGEGLHVALSRSTNLLAELGYSGTALACSHALAAWRKTTSS